MVLIWLKCLIVSTRACALSFMQTMGAYRTNATQKSTRLTMIERTSFPILEIVTAGIFVTSSQLSPPRGRQTATKCDLWDSQYMNIRDGHSIDWWTERTLVGASLDGTLFLGSQEKFAGADLTDGKCRKKPKDSYLLPKTWTHLWNKKTCWESSHMLWKATPRASIGLEVAPKTNKHLHS